ncbi:hypothetical protein BHM03_00046679 [Ensete ventricosum]|nr:hypothetical protein BHM03_00046679 [Ensete ventricosum]
MEMVRSDLEQVISTQTVHYRAVPLIGVVFASLLPETGRYWSISTVATRYRAVSAWLRRGRRKKKEKEGEEEGKPRCVLIRRRPPSPNAEDVEKPRKVCNFDLYRLVRSDTYWSAGLPVGGPPATGRFRQKSIVGDRLKKKLTIGGRLRKKKGRRRGKDKKKKEGKKEYLARGRGRFFSHVRRRSVSPRGEKDRGDTARYRMVPRKIDCRRSISIVDGRLRENR